MTALLQVLLLYGLLLLIFGRLGFRRVLLIAVVVSLPLRTTYEFFYNGVGGWTNGITVSIADLVALALAMSQWNAGSRTEEGDPGLRRAMIALLAASLLSLVNSQWLRMTLFQNLAFLQWILLYYVVIRRALTSWKDAEAICLAFSASLLLQGLIGCAQFASGQNFLLFSTGANMGESILIDDAGSEAFARVFGTLGKPNAYGSHLALLFLVGLVTSRLDVGWRWFRRISLVFGLLGLILSFSRGAWLSSVVALMAYGVLVAKWDGIRMGKILRFGMVGLVLLLPLYPYVHERLTSDDHNAAMSRVQLVSIAWKMIEEHPLIGIGANTYKSEMRQYLPADYSQSYVDQVHNFYLLVCAECGLFGLIALCWLFLRLVVGSYRHATRGESAIARYFGGAVFVATVQILAYSMVDMYHGRLGIASIFILCALLDFAIRIEADLQTDGQIEDEYAGLATNDSRAFPSALTA